MDKGWLYNEACIFNDAKVYNDVETDCAEILKREKKVLIENVLGTQLTEEQLADVEINWNAFYKEPDKYRNSVVIDMVNLFLQDHCSVPIKELKSF